MNPGTPPVAPMNRTAVISVVAGLLTLLSFCTAVAPIPLTGYICYPAAVMLGLVALITGVMSLAQIRATREEGRSYALVGISIGMLTVIAALCATALGIALFPKVVALVHRYVK